MLKPPTSFVIGYFFLLVTKTNGSNGCLGWLLTTRFFFSFPVWIQVAFQGVGLGHDFRDEVSGIRTLLIQLWSTREPSSFWMQR